MNNIARVTIQTLAAALGGVDTLATASFDEALSLPCEDRIYVVDRLLRSLNAPIREEIDQLWAQEVEARIDDLDSGKAELIPGEQVFAEIRKRLGK